MCLLMFLKFSSPVILPKSKISPLNIVAILSTSSVLNFSSAVYRLRLQVDLAERVQQNPSTADADFCPL
jgi:hypothetical protein